MREHSQADQVSFLSVIDAPVVARHSAAATICRLLGRGPTASATAVLSNGPTKIQGGGVLTLIISTRPRFYDRLVAMARLVSLSKVKVQLMSQIAPRL